MNVDPLLRLYPGAWRRRYAPEVAALLVDAPPDWRDRIDLLRGALDAHLHPISPAAWPVYAAAVGGIAWTFAGALALGQPAPLDWPGYLAETLPLLAGAAPLLALAAIGASTRLGDPNPAVARLGRAIVALGSSVWTVLLVAATANLVGGTPLAIAATATAAGTLLLGMALLGAGDGLVGTAMLAAAVCLVVPTPWAPVAYGAAWMAVAVLHLLDPRPATHRLDPPQEAPGP